MYVLGHVGIPVAAVWLGSRRWPLLERVDHRLLALGALLPDLLDKGLLAPLALAPAKAFGHSLVFTLLLAAFYGLHASFARPALSLALGTASHLLLDIPWTFPGALLWPLLGDFPPWPLFSPEGYLRLLLSSGYLIGGEVAGAALLVIVAIRSGLAEPAARLRLLATGRLATRPDRQSP